MISTAMEEIRLRLWEFNLLLLEVLLFGSAALGAGAGLLRRAGLPDIAAFGLFFVAFGLVLFPIQSVQSRIHGHTLRFGRWLLMTIAGAIVGAAIWQLMAR